MVSNYQEPIEKKDLDLGKKFSEENSENVGVSPAIEKKEAEPFSEAPIESSVESHEDKVSEKIEATRKSISTQQAIPAANIVSDSQAISEEQDFEKKVEKLVELAVQKGPEHAIHVAQHMDKGKEPSSLDNFSLDEVHDKLMEDELRGQLMQRGLLKEL